MDGVVPMEISPPPSAGPPNPSRPPQPLLPPAALALGPRAPVAALPALGASGTVSSEPEGAAAGRPGPRHEKAPRIRRQCVCGRRISGTVRKVDGVELCDSCRQRCYRGLPQLHKAAEPAPAPVAAPSAAARRRELSPSPPLLPPLPDIAHATRARRAALEQSSEALEKSDFDAASSDAA